MDRVKTLQRRGMLQSTRQSLVRHDGSLSAGFVKDTPQHGSSSPAQPQPQAPSSRGSCAIPTSQPYLRPSLSCCSGSAPPASNAAMVVVCM